MELDCIIIGYNQVSLSDIIGGVEVTKDLSGAYNHLSGQTVVLKGKRYSYSDLIKECISHSTGKPCNSDIFKMPSFGVHYLVSFLRKKGLSAEPVNYFNFDKERLIELLGESPKAVGISTSFYVDPDPVKEIVEFIRSYNKETTIIVGGTYINNVCFEMDLKQQNWFFKDMAADIYINDLQGELTLSKVCQELKKDNPDLTQIPNLIYRVGKEFYRAPREKENNELDYNYVNCYSFGENEPIPAVFTRTSRSCSNECAFCRYPFLGGEYTLASLDSVEEELDYLHSLGVKYLIFVDDTFNIPLERYKDLLRMLIRKQYNFKWFSYFRCSDADDEAFDLIAEAGCTGVFLGIESGDPGIIINMNKKATIDQYRYGIDKLNSKGILTLASFMVGFPGETEETVSNTIKFIQETKPTFYSLQMYFHESKVPIASKADIYGLTGGGYSWCHNTMDWKTASKLVYEGHQNIKDSLFIPLYTFNIWSICYYMSQGLTKEELCEFLKIAKEMMLISSIDPDPAYMDGQDKKIFSVFKNSKI